MVRKEQTRLQDHPCYGLFVATAYGVCSITITLFNKAVFSFYDFKFPITLFIAQMCFSLCFVWALKLAYPDKYGFPITVAMSKKLLPMALGWATYGISGVIALRYLNVPMFSSFRRFTSIIVMYGEYRMRGRLPPMNQRLAVVTMCVGAAVAGLTDLTFSLPGYCWVATCAVSTALYLLFIDKLGKESGLHDTALLFYNNMLAMPFMLVALLVSGELSEVPSFPRLYDLDFQIFFVVSAMQAFFLNFLIFLCTRINSPLVTSVTGTVKDLFTNMLGMTLFGDFPYNPPNVVSIAVCLGGSVWYSRLKYVASGHGQPQKAPSEESKLEALEEGQPLMATVEEGAEPAAVGSSAPAVPAGLGDLLKGDGGGSARAAPAPMGEPGRAPPQPAPPGAGGAMAGGVRAGGGGDRALMDRKKALEQQLAELEAQMNAAVGDSHHTD